MGTTLNLCHARFSSDHLRIDFNATLGPVMYLDWVTAWEFHRAGMVRLVSFSFLICITILSLISEILLSTLFVNGFSYHRWTHAVLVRSLKLSNVGTSVSTLDGWPPGNTGCCWLVLFTQPGIPSYQLLRNYEVTQYWHSLTYVNGHTTLNTPASRPISWS